MQLLLIRHAKAEDRDTSTEAGVDDAFRPLTSNGKQRMKAAARGLRRLHRKIDVLATSPLKRAVQTAKILYAVYDDAPQFLELPLLSGGHHPCDLITWLKSQNLETAAVALVGHEPDLGVCAGYFVTGREKSIVGMKKGTVCVIDFPTTLAAGKGIIAGVYHLGHLRKIV